MKATLNGKTLRLELPCLKEATPSGSGRSNHVAKFSGLTDVTDDNGTQLRVGCTAYVYPEPREALNGRQTGVKCSVAPGKKKGDPAILTLEVPTFKPRDSSSGKSLLIASASGGTGFRIAEREVQLSLNAGFDKPKAPKA